ncbi:MAG: hypothetical protein M1827_005207 [Pycnora praestabilis]|nr:MAG: hypothetical protein M1827_005207 [Pycnora praestabilis]
MESTALEGLDINLLSPLSLFSQDDHSAKRSQWLNNGNENGDGSGSGSGNGSVNGNSNGKAKKAASPRNNNGKPLLACLNCRPRKVKCQLEADGCRRCTKLGLQCVVPEGDERRRPSSKTHIRELEQRISFLEKALKEARSTQPQPQHENSILPAIEDVRDAAIPELQPSIDTDLSSDVPSSLIGRLCGMKWQLNSDEVGQLRFFGPTSSLHLTESVSSSILHWGENTTRRASQMQDDVPLALQEYLLDQYWKYQHTVLQVVHKEAFLNDMRTGQCRYFSKLLQYCIFACAARISDQPQVRALALSADDDDEEQPFFVKKATALLEQELESPRITTIQALQLLSVLECAKSKDTKGWLYSGHAIRLIFDLGLHRDCSQLDSANLTQTDLEVRQVVFWGCFGFDRLWALYLGRPHFIKLDDITVPRPGSDKNVHSWEMRMSAAWTGLLDIVGQTCDALNGNACTTTRVGSLNKQLLDWQSHLDEELQYIAGGPASVCLLHLQLSSAMILLHRPAAGFGVVATNPSSASMESRETCVYHATKIARLLEDYRQCYGSACTILGTGLYNITTAATTLIADMVDRRSMDMSHHFSSIRTCIFSLKELEKSYLSARRVRKQLNLVMRLCNLESQPMEDRIKRKEIEQPIPQNNQAQAEIEAESIISEQDQSISDIMILENSPFTADDFLMTISQCDLLQSFEPWYGHNG